MKKAFALILSFLLFLYTVPTAFAASTKATEAADTLYALGLFNGTGTTANGKPIFDLDRAPTRQEAITMLVRLLGKETAAKRETWDIPFTDVDPWARPYVGYAYAKGLTNGMGAATFGSDQKVSAAQYVTFILRALGYSSETDFDWREALKKSDALGITDGSYSTAGDAAFFRGDAAIISASALGSNLKDTESTLLEVLVADGAVSAAAAEASGILPDKYTLFAREMLSAKGTEHVITVSPDNQVTSADLSNIVGNYDIYSSAAFDIAPNDPQLKEKLLVSALKHYASECVDGDYSDNIEPNFSIGLSPQFAGSFILTDSKGMILGYTVYEELRPSEITVVTLYKDSKPLIDSSVADFDRLYDSLTVVSCDMTKEGGNYLYQFSGIPANAVWMDTCGSGSKANSSKSAINEKKQISTYQRSIPNMLANGYFDGFAVRNPYSEKAFYALDLPGYAYTIFVFLDANYDLVGYSIGRVSA